MNPDGLNGPRTRSGGLNGLNDLNVFQYMKFSVRSASNIRSLDLTMEK